MHEKEGKMLPDHVLKNIEEEEEEADGSNPAKPGFEEEEDEEVYVQSESNDN